MAGFTAIAPKTDVVTIKDGKTTTTTTKDNIWLPPHAYLTYQLNDRYWLGVGIYSRFGLGTEYPDDWPGKYNVTYAGIKSISFNPNLAIKLTDDLSFAFGLETMWFEFTQEKVIAPNPLLGINQEIQTKLVGDSIGYGFNVALHYKPTNWLAMGITYKSQVEQTVKGDMTFDNPAVKDRGAKGDITLPDSFTAGIMIEPVSQLTLETDIIYTRWSTYDELTIEFEEPLFGVLPAQTYEKDWHDTWRFQFGAEYSLNDLVNLRASYVYDQSPIPDDHVDYMVPASNRHLFGLGAGIHWNNWTVDLSYTYLLIESRDIDASAEGIYDGEFKNGHSHLIGLSIGYKF
jgi:long-chain fatty acid transport protein